MNFPVIWRPQALQELAHLWTMASDRNAVTEASERLDRLLASEPLTAGESREGNDRIAFDRPLAVKFRPDAAARVVFVLSVGWSGRPG